MAVATFDTLKFANTLKAAGVPDKQAEAQAMAFAEVIQLNLKDLVTKDDLSQAEQRLSAKIDTLEARLRGEMVLMKWMLGVVIIGVVGILIRLFVYRGGF
jgi:2-phosphoglycerate kinase